MQEAAPIAVIGQGDTATRIVPGGKPGSMTVETGESRPAWLKQEDEKTYFANPALGSTDLKTFRKCPRTFALKRAGVIPGTKPGRWAAFGTAAHALILEGREKFAEVAAVEGRPIDPKTKAPFKTTSCKAWAKAEEAAGKIILSEEEEFQIEAMNASVKENEVAASLLSDGVAEGVVRAKVEGVEIQARIDWFNTQAGIIVDLKTTASLDEFAARSVELQYREQMAHYAMAVEAASGRPVLSAFIIAVEKDQPFRCGVFGVTPDAMKRAKERVREDLVSFAQCEQSNQFPSAFDGITDLAAVG